MTVKELKTILADVDDDAEVMVGLKRKNDYDVFGEVVKVKKSALNHIWIVGTDY
jgi:hypothetical protein